jgi:response regulator RpfG family c-di-GMP phosphodiesterase
MIDDDIDDREFFKIALEEADNSIKLITSSSGAEGLKLLSVLPQMPDYIFLDLNIPHMDGREFLSLVKSEPRTMQIPVIIFTTSSHDRDRDETRELGAHDFVTKPPSISELTNTLTSLLIKPAIKINK